MTTFDISVLFEKKKLFLARMVSFDKRAKPGHTCVWNSNAVIKSQGKVWYGDIDITKDGKILKELAKELGEPIYILRERDCRFETQNDSIDTLIGKAVWNTDQEII